MGKDEGVVGVGRPEKVLDSKGVQIEFGAIVGVAEHLDLLWDRFQGLVVEPFVTSDEEDERVYVAVFFATEVSNSYFNAPPFEIVSWDRRHYQDIKNSNFGFLLGTDIWKTCPRIVLFQPNELVVQDCWKISTLTKRMFSRMHHTVYELPKGITSKKPSDYRCFIDGCENAATKVALFNVWGSVYPMFVCDNCFPNTNGFCGDDLPKMKKPFLLVDGTPV